MRRFFTTTSEISRYLYRVIRDYGFYVRYSHSDTSESRYLKICLGSREAPLALHVRISDHPIPRFNTTVRYDYDIYASRARKGAVSYIKFLVIFARDHGLIPPSEIGVLLPGTARYRNYIIAMQRHAAA